MLVDRRSLLSGALGSLAAAADTPAWAKGVPAPVATSAAAGQDVWLVGDDAPANSAEMSLRLARLASAENIQDGYLAGGAVEQLEQRFAKLLGKEACAFLPTGTLANHLAMRVLCGAHPRALCQYDSHLYRDESDSTQGLSGINLVPLAPGRVAPSMAELVAAFDGAEKGPYPLKIGAISLESPVRRLHGEMIPAATVADIAALAAKHGTPMHLDGARLLLAPPSLDVKAYAAPFETVYISLYKYLGAPFGAVLAGPKARITKVREDRHLFGGLIYQGWIPAALALERVGTIRADMARAVAAADALVAALQRLGPVRKPLGLNPSNIYLLEMPQALAATARERGHAVGIRLAEWKDGVLPLTINRTIMRRSVADYARLFMI